MNHLEKLPEHYKNDLDRKLCVCNEVSTLDIVNAIVNGAVSVEAIRKQTYATDGNGCCRVQVEGLIKHLTS